jgi:hypothetical protein
MDLEKDQKAPGVRSEADLRPDSSHDVTHEIPVEIEHEFLVGKQASLLIFSITMTGFLYSLDVNIIVTVSLWSTESSIFCANNSSKAIPVMTTYFHTIRDIGWYGGAYLITV